MWDLPGPGIKPVSPELAGGFVTTVPPGKSPTFLREKGDDSELLKPTKLFLWKA